ncbi:MAG TPA: DNA topoisomerase IB [bacterium]|nr:DNA topoisomerase IB [bacterium]
MAKKSSAKMKSRRSKGGAAITLVTEPAEAAKAAALRYVSDQQPGIQRHRKGSGFRYLSPSGEIIRDPAALARIRSIVIPPAWTEVWICPAAHGHLQATGRDARGRKQYRYHTRWREVRDETKYGRMVQFGSLLPRIRERVASDLGLSGLPRNKLLAVIVRLLETTFMRVGNDEYARTNQSFGLTTLLDRHVTIEGAKMRFRFRGKSGKVHSIETSDRRLSRVIQRSRDLPGQELFQYLDEADVPQSIDSADVNEYLRTLSDEDFTSKDFRTWGGTLLAAAQLGEPADREANVSAKSIVARAVEAVALQLGNTPAVCRKCYIHPAVLEIFADMKLLEIWRTECISCPPRSGLSQEESALLKYLESFAGQS